MVTPTMLWKAAGGMVKWSPMVLFIMLPCFKKNVLSWVSVAQNIIKLIQIGMSLNISFTSSTWFTVHNLHGFLFLFWSISSITVALSRNLHYVKLMYPIISGRSFFKSMSIRCNGFFLPPKQINIFTKLLIKVMPKVLSFVFIVCWIFSTYSCLFFFFFLEFWIRTVIFNAPKLQMRTN